MSRATVTYDPTMSERDHFVYQYLDPDTGETVYVGYGKSTSRALSHAESHNRELRDWLRRERFRLRVAGPYPTEAIGLMVEAALISAMRPKFNVATGTGPRFRPLGVVDELSDRLSLPPLTVADVGRMSGGALIVYIASSKAMRDGRPKYDPAHPDPEVVAIDVEGWWQLGRHVDEWSAHPERSPRVLVGAYGPPKHRFVIGAYQIETENWRVDGQQRPKLWKVPLRDRTDHDAAGLSGRRIRDLRFGRAKWEHYRVVTANGRVTWPSE